MPIEMNHGKPTITGLPRNTKITIAELPSRAVIIETRASKAFTPALDPGAYVYTAYHSDPTRYGAHGAWREKGEFLVDLTREQVIRLHALQPRMSHGLMTSDGPRWRCGDPRCREAEFTSKIAVLIHEGEHLGVDMLRDDPETIADAETRAHMAAKPSRQGPPPPAPKG